MEALENHVFDPVRVLQWRNPDLDFSSLPVLRDSLAAQPREHGLLRAPMGEDVAALEILAREDDVAGSPAAAPRWSVSGRSARCPTTARSRPRAHADLVAPDLPLPDAGRAPCRRTGSRAIFRPWTGPTGDIDTLSNRIAQVRTWSFIANRPDWLADPEHWQGVARQVEDKLSDALHERLAQRFVDRRTSVLMRRLRENAMLEAEITPAGDVTVEGQHVGHLHGFHFVPDPQADQAEPRRCATPPRRRSPARSRARAERFSAAADTSLVLANDGAIRWQGDPVAKLEPGDKLFEPRLRLLADEQLTGPARDKVEARLTAWLKAHIVRLLGPALQLEEHAELHGPRPRHRLPDRRGARRARTREGRCNDVRSLDQDGRGALRKLGVRFGAYHLYLPALLKPAPRTLAAQLWALQHGGLDQPGLDEIAHLASSGRTSIPVDPDIAHGLYRAAGFRVCGGRAVRVDILERLADLIRPAIGLSARPDPGRAAFRRRRRRRLRCHRRDDLPRRLRRRGFRLHPEIARLRRSTAAPARPSRCRCCRPRPSCGRLLRRSRRPRLRPTGWPPRRRRRPRPSPSLPKPRRREPDAPVETGEAFSGPARTAEGSVTAVAPEPEPIPSSESADPVETASETSAEPGPEAVDRSAEAAPAPAAEAIAAAPEAVAAVPEAAEAEPAAEEAAPEAVAAAPEAGEAMPEAGEAAPAVEPVLIDVWRLGRRHQEGGRHHHHGRKRPERRADGEGGPERRPRPERPPGEGPPRRERPRPERSGEERRAEGGENRRAEGGENRSGPRPPRGPHRSDDRRGPRPDRRFEERRGQERREERREKQPDPNSPFAKLLALKAQLEDQGGNKR